LNLSSNLRRMKFKIFDLKLVGRFDITSDSLGTFIQELKSWGQFFLMEDSIMFRQTLSTAHSFWKTDVNIKGTEYQYGENVCFYSLTTQNFLPSPCFFSHFLLLTFAFFHFNYKPKSMLIFKLSNTVFKSTENIVFALWLKMNLDRFLDSTPKSGLR